jgi:hypothetical protein
MQPSSIPPLQAALEQRARDLIWAGCEWLTADQIREHSGDGPAGDPPDLEQWMHDRKVFSVVRDGLEYFPTYVFDAHFRPLPAIQSILEILHVQGPEGLAAWFESTSSFLGGARPREILGVAPERAIAAAQDFDVAMRYAG